MEHSADSELTVMITAADLRQGQEEAGKLLARLAQTFETALPGQTRVRRGGWFFSKEKPVREVAVDFGDESYVMSDEGHARLSATMQKRVRGVVLKTESLELDDWLARVAAHLTMLAGKSSRARLALHKFTQG